MSEEKPVAANRSKEGSTSSIASLSDAKAVEANIDKKEPQLLVSRDEDDAAKVEEIPAGAQSPVDEIEYPTKWKLTLITIALCLSVFCMALDNTIIATAIPKITDQFHALDDIGWFVSVYLLTTCGFQLIYGRCPQYQLRRDLY
jgi:hypothetical protein